MTYKTDREMLELAAKAAGYDVVWNEIWQCFQHREPIIVRGQERHAWIPKDDDGDAFRLGVKLGILATGPEVRHFLSLERFANQDKDDCYAYRCAIVRAAAAIGAKEQK